MQMKLNLLRLENGIQLSLGVSLSRNCGAIVSIFDDDVDAAAAAAAALDAFCTVKLDIVSCKDVLPNPRPQRVNTTIFSEK